MTDVWAPTPGRPYVTDAYQQATGITNTLALPDNTPHRGTPTSATAKPQQAFTADSTLTFDDLAWAATNTGATATVTLTLPAAGVGRVVVATRLAAYALRLKPSTGETIRNGAVNGYLELTGYVTVVLECLVAGTWEVVSDITAGWRLENGYSPINGFLRSFSVSSFGGDPTGNVDSTANVQAAIDATSVAQGMLIVDGQYKVTTQLKGKDNCIIIGSGDNFQSQLVFYNSDANVPLLFNGAGGVGSGNLLKRCGLRDLTLNFTNWTGSSAHAMEVSDIYSSAFDNVVIFDDSASHGSKYALRVNGNTGDVKFTRFRRDGSGTIAACAYIDSTSEFIRNLVFDNPDMERAGKGVWLTGSANPMSVTITAPYHESCSAGIYWDNSNANSQLTVVGGEQLLPNAGSYGVTILQDNITVLGGHYLTSAGGVYSVYNGATSRLKNAHVIGGQPGLTVYDPKNWLTTNSQRSEVEVWDAKAYNRKTTVVDNTVTSLFRIFPAYGTTYLAVPLLVEVTVMTYIKDSNVASRSQKFTFHVQWQDSTNTSVSNVVASTATVYEVSANYTTAITATTVATAGGYVDFKIQPNSGGASGDTLPLMLWAKCEILSDGTNTASYVQAL